MQNLSIPSIPSRFLTPVLRFDLQEKDVDALKQNSELLNKLNQQSDFQSGSIQEAINTSRSKQADGMVESVLVARVARLTNDGSTLGPGAYNVDQSSRVLGASPRGAVKWQHSKSRRMGDVAGKTQTSTLVGPGAYNTMKKLDRTIQNPTIPRAAHPSRTIQGFGRRKATKNNGTIRDNFEEVESESDADSQNGRKPYVDKETSPGPGKYLNSTHMGTVGAAMQYMHNHPGNFGHTAQRFKEKPTGSHLGPGQYLS